MLPPTHGLTDYYNLLADEGVVPPGEAMLKGKAAAEKALQLDPHFTPAKASLASFKLVRDWDFQGSEKDFQTLLADNPNSDSIVYDLYAITLRTLGRGDESIAAMHKALQLDPLSVSVSTELGWALYYFRHYDQAIAQFRDTLVLQSDYAPAHSAWRWHWIRKAASPKRRLNSRDFLRSQSTSRQRRTFTGPTCVLDTRRL